MRAIAAWSLACLVFLPLGVGCAPDRDQGVASAWEGTGDRRDSSGVNSSKVKDAPSPRISPLTHYAAGNMLERQNNLKGAIEQYEKALAASPRMIQAYNRLGIVYQKLAKFEDAERILRQGIRLHPDSAMLHNNLGFCLLQKEAYAAAESEFRAALALMPHFSRARMNLGITLARTGRFDDGAIEFSRVVTGDVAFYNVALVCLDRHSYVAAEQALRRSLRVNPAYEPAKAKLARVTKLADASRGAASARLAEDAAADGRTWGRADSFRSVPLAAQASDGDEDGS